MDNTEVPGDIMPDTVNDNLVLIGGASGSGKSAGLRNLPNPEGVLYINCESGKKLPFRNKFNNFVITDPYQVYGAFEQARDVPDECHTIVIDTSTFLMDMFISTYIMGAKDTMKGWALYAEFFRVLMQKHVALAPQNVIILAHVEKILNQEAMEMEEKVPVKGSLAKNGIEAFFSTAVTARKMTIKDLQPYVEGNKLLNITAKEQALGFKHVFQTQITADTINSRVRGPMGMWDDNETFIDNDVTLIIQRFNEYYQ